MIYFSTPLKDSQKFQIAGFAEDLSGVEAAGSLCELVRLGEQTTRTLKKQIFLFCVLLLLLSCMSCFPSSVLDTLVDAGCLHVGLLAIWVLHRLLTPSVRALFCASRHQAARRRAARRTFRRDARDASLFILGIASMAVILTGSATPPLHQTHPILSYKWGPSVHSSATTSPHFVHHGSHQPLSMLGTVHSTPPLRDRVTAMPEEQLASLPPPVAQSGVSSNNILLIWMLSKQEQSLQLWQPASMSAAAAATPPAAVACTSHPLAVVLQQAMQTTTSDTREASTALAVPSHKTPTSKRMDSFQLWAYSIKEQSLQQWQPHLSLSSAAAATSTASMLQSPPSVIATASTAHGVSTPTISKPRDQSSADVLTLRSFWANEQSMQQWQPEFIAHAAVAPSTQAVAKPGAIATVPAAKQLYLPGADLTAEAAVARSASAIEQRQTTAAPLAPVLSTAQASSPEDVPAELKPLGSVPAILFPVKTTTQENYPAVIQWCMGSILGQVVLGVFMLALDGVILPGKHSCLLMTIIPDVFCSAVMYPPCSAVHDAVHEHVHHRELQGLVPVQSNRSCFAHVVC